jgi:molybdopterin synthase sulfur carrier subunit
MRGDQLHILYFAWLRERVGRSEETLDATDSLANVADLVAALRARSPGHAAALAEDTVVRCAVNQVFAKPETPIKPGDEIAFFPPVTGG